MRHTVRLTPLLLIAVLLVAACSGGDEQPAPDPVEAGAVGGESEATIAAQRAVLATQGVFVDDPDHVRYLSSIDQAWDEFTGRDASASQERRETDEEDPQRATLFQSLLDAGAGAAFAAVRTAASAIEPPPAYEADFAIFNAYLNELVDADVRVADAAQAGDLVAMTLANVDLQLAGIRARSRLQSTTCGVIFGEQCPPPEPQGASTYERALRFEVDELSGALGVVLPVFVGPQRGFNLAFSAEEDQRYAAGIVERGIALVDVTRVAIQAVEPTPDYASDHEALATLVEELAVLLDEAADTIPTPAWRAGADRTLGGRMLGSLCQTAESLSDAAKALSSIERFLVVEGMDVCETGLPRPPQTPPAG